MSDDDLFRPVSAPWRTVSPALATARRLLLLPPLLALAAAAGAGAALLGDPTWLRVLLGALGVATLLGTAGAWVWAERNRRSWGYAEDAEDLLVTGGVMFRRLVAVPYGRMQFVDVTAGPLARRLGIATVTLHTASQETAAGVPGVPAEEARRLRDRLTELGEAHGAGL